MTLTVEFPMTLPSMANARLHWAAKARKVKAQRLTTGLALRDNGVGWRLKPLAKGQRLVVTLTRVAPRKLDSHDNLRTALKHVVDEVAAFFHVDDSDPRIEWRYAQAKGSSSVRIELEAV